MSSSVMTMLTGRCPRCHEGHIYTSVLGIKTQCESCGAVLMRDPGAWTGATAVAYMMGSGFAVCLILFMLATGRLMQEGSELIIAPTVVVFQLVSFRFVKGFWVGMLFDMGYVYPNEPPAPVVVLSPDAIAVDAESTAALPAVDSAPDAVETTPPV